MGLKETVSTGLREMRSRAYALLEKAGQYEQMGRQEEANRFYERALEIMPSLMFTGTHPSAPYKRGKRGKGTVEDVLDLIKKGLTAPGD